MSAWLRRVELEGDWGDFVSLLDGWRRGPGGVWSGSGADILDNRGASNMCVELSAQGGGSDAVSSIRIRGQEQRITGGGEARSPVETIGVPCLNHVALDLPVSDTVIVDHLKSKSVEVFLPRLVRFDPQLDQPVEAEHLVSGNDLYLTARFWLVSGTRTLLSHVGWQCRNEFSIDEIASRLVKIGWPIVYGPDTVDGSYLVHFRGPDGRDHDIFFVLPV